MDSELKRFLRQERVKEETIEALINDEFFTAMDLTSASEELLKSCGITGGQVLRVKNACAEFVKQTSIQESSPSSKQSPTLERTSSSKENSPSSSSPSPQQSKTPLSSSKTPAISPCHDQAVKSSWLVNFQLPSSFSPAVTKALGDKTLAGNRRNELTRDICSAIRVHTMFPTKAEREHVAFLLIRQYPFLEDPLGNGIGSWETAFKNRFKNQRKTGQKSGVNSMLNGGDKRDDVPSPPVSKKRRLEECYEIPEGETKDTCKDHIKAMKQEFAKSSNKNQSMIKDLMVLTHPFRREWLLQDMVPVEQFITEYPALKTVSGMKAEFARILGKKNPIKDMAEIFRQTWQEKILSYAKSQSTCKDILDCMQEAITDSPTKKTGIEEAAAVRLVPLLLKEKAGNASDFLKICTEEEFIDDVIEDTKSPRIVCSGDYWQPGCLCIAAEGVKVLDFESGAVPMATALGLLVASFYCFNIVYPTKSANAYLFCEAALLDIHNNAKKRVAVNKFISALNFQE